MLCDLAVGAQDNHCARTFKANGNIERFVPDDLPIERWIALEMGGIARALVAAPRIVGDLMLEREPTAPLRDGGVHRFDRGSLEVIHRALSPLARRRVKLPVTFFVDRELPSDAYLPDAHAVDLLRALGEIPADREMREGRLWLGLAFAQGVAQKYPTAFQFVYH